MTNGFSSCAMSSHKNKKNQHKGRRKRMTYAHIISAYRDLQGLHTKYASDMR